MSAANSILICTGVSNLDFSEWLMSLAFVLIASICAVEQHNVRYSVRDNVRPLTIKTFCFVVAHFCCVGNFTFYLVNITLYCFVTVSLKKLFGLFFQSIVDFKSYERNDIKGPGLQTDLWHGSQRTKRTERMCSLLGGQCAERLTVVTNTSTL